MKIKNTLDLTKQSIKLKLIQYKHSFLHLVSATKTSPFVRFDCSHINHNYNNIKISLVDMLKSNLSVESGNIKTPKVSMQLHTQITADFNIVSHISYILLTYT